MKVGVVVFPGSNCDRDCKVAIERSTGAHVDMVWHGDSDLPDGLDLIVLPGGFGTLDELFEAVTLAQTHKVNRFPVVLLGTDYWGGMIAWLRDTVMPAGMIGPEDLDRLVVTDDVVHAVEVVRSQDRPEQRRG